MDSDNDEWSDWSGCQDYLLDTQTDEVNIVNEDAGTAIPVDGSKTEDEPETVCAGESNNGNLHDQGLTANTIEVTITNQRDTKYRRCYYRAPYRNTKYRRCQHREPERDTKYR